MDPSRLPTSHTRAREDLVGSGGKPWAQLTSWKAAQFCSLLRGLRLCFYVLPLVIVFVALRFSLSLLVSPLNMWLPCVTYETARGKGVLN